MPMQQVKNKKDDGDGGSIVYIHAKIQTGDAKARISDLNPNEKERVEDIRVSLEDLPKFPRLPKKYLLEECSVIYDTKKEEVLAINPYSGIFLAIGMALGPRPEGEDSEPKAEQSKEKIGQDGKPYTTMNFHEIFKILDEQEADGVFYGTTPRLFLQDKFAETSDGLAGYTGTDKSRWTLKLKKFGEVQGLYDEDITWPEDGNMLPILEERILDNGRQVRLTFEEGFINNITPAGKAKVVVQEVEVDDEPAPVKRSEKELKAELGYTVDTDNLTRFWWTNPRKLRKPLRKLLLILIVMMICKN